MSPNGIKVAVRYKDDQGREFTKNCGTSREKKELIAWIGRKGFTLISTESVEQKASARAMKRPKRVAFSR